MPTDRRRIVLVAGLTGPVILAAVAGLWVSPASGASQDVSHVSPSNASLAAPASPLLNVNLGGRSPGADAAGPTLDPIGLVHQLARTVTAPLHPSPTPSSTRTSHPRDRRPTPAPTPAAPHAQPTHQPHAGSHRAKHGALRHGPLTFRGRTPRADGRHRAELSIPRAHTHVSARKIHHVRHRAFGSQFLHDVVRPGSPAQILTLLVIMCAVGTAFMVSLARRKEAKPVKVRSRHR